MQIEEVTVEDLRLGDAIFFDSLPIRKTDTSIVDLKVVAEVMFNTAIVGGTGTVRYVEFKRVFDRMIDTRGYVLPKTQTVLRIIRTEETEETLDENTQFLVDEVFGLLLRVIDNVSPQQQSLAWDHLAQTLHDSRKEEPDAS